MSDIFSYRALSGYVLISQLPVSVFVKSLPMPPIGKEVTDFVRACEVIQALLERQHTLTPEDRDLIEFNAHELLDKLTLT